MNIYDCFMFFDEELLLDVRLNELNKYVKKFIITESKYTHSGKERKLLFDINKFSKFKEKIDYIVLENEPKNISKVLQSDSENIKNSKFIMNAVIRENYQRNCLMKGLKNVDNNDLIMVSDLDEIPNLEKKDLNNIPNKIILFEQKNFYYKFNLFLKNFKWFGTKACKFKYFKSPQWLRNIKSKKYGSYRLDTFFSKTKYQDICFLSDGGWHFSYLKDAKSIETKLKSYLHHREYDLEPLGAEKINELINANIPVYNLRADMKQSKFNSNFKLIKSEIHELPKYVKENMHLFKEWFI